MFRPIVPSGMKDWDGQATYRSLLPTANINMSTAGFLTKWLGDLAADQNEAGSIPHVVPNVLGEGAYGSAGWGDAGLIVPCPCTSILETPGSWRRQYESMKAGWIL
jgi:alpha-L-rhamnosidase